MIYMCVRVCVTPRNYLELKHETKQNWGPSRSQGQFCFTWSAEQGVHTLLDKNNICRC